MITDEELQQIVQQRARVQVISKKTYEREAESLAKQVAYLKALKNYGVRHTISYHSRVAFAQAFSAPENACGIHAVHGLVKLHEKAALGFQAFHVNGMMSAGERSAILKDFAEAPYSVVSNARCLTEGVDIPFVDGVLFFDPKYRLTDIVQATGRAIRLHPGKKYGYLIVPVFIKEDGDVEIALESSDFSQVWSVIKAMQSQDERLDEVISKLRTLDGKIKGGNRELSSVRSSAEEKLFEKIQVFNVPRKVSAQKFVQAVETQLLENLGRSWDYMYGLLLEFRKKHPDQWPEARGEFPKGNRLGGWCNNQRKSYKTNQLSKERIRVLEKIRFEWDPLETIWQKQFRYLVEFRKKYPNRWPMQPDEYPPGNQLAAWCNTQRLLRRTNRLSRGRVHLLEKIRFEWDPVETVWLQSYQRLVEFRKKYPSRWPPQRREFPKGNRLGAWCVHQREFHRNKRLPQERFKLLDEIGFQWNAPDANWQQQYRYLVEYRKKYPRQWPEARKECPKGNGLGNWCNAQRSTRRANKLSKDRILLLNKINFEWDPLATIWRQQYNCLVVFRKKYPNRWPAQRTKLPEERRLASWCLHQRNFYRRKRLSHERISLLEKIGFLWNPLDLNWQQQFRCLVEYRSKHPREWPEVKTEFPKGNNLGMWCAKKRSLFRRKKLPEKQFMLLKKIGFEWRS